jgi:hypothetical protein
MSGTGAHLSAQIRILFENQVGLPVTREAGGSPERWTGWLASRGVMLLPVTATVQPWSGTDNATLALVNPALPGHESALSQPKT